MLAPPFKLFFLMRIFNSFGLGLGFAAVCALLPNRLAAQSWQWVATPAAANTGTVTIAATALDSNGNLVVAGGFTGTVQLGGSTLTSAGGTDLFVARLSPAGSWLQAVSAGGSQTDQVTALVPDAGGDIVVVGNFASQGISFGTTTLNNETAAGAVSDVFIARLDAAGDWDGAVQAGGPGADYAAAAARDRSGTVTVVGSFAGATFHAGTTTLTNSVSNNTSSDVFAVQLTRVGTWGQAVRLGGAGDELAGGVAIDAGGVAVVAGSFFSATLAVGTTTLTNADNTGDVADGFIAKLSPSGTWTQAVQAGDIGGDYIRAVGLDAAGNSVVAGDFSGVTTKFGSTTLTNAEPGGTTSDLFVARLDATGTWTQAVRGGTAGIEYANALVVDANGQAVVAGSFYGATLSLGGITLTNANTSGNASGDVFVARLDATGTWTHAAQAGGVGDDYGASLACDAAGVAYVGGVVGNQGAQFGSVAVPAASRTIGFAARLNGLPAMPLGVRSGQSEKLAVQLYPNPASGETVAIAYSLPAASRVCVEVLDALGRPVVSIAPTALRAAGAHTIDVPITGLASGLYLVRVTEGETVTCHRLAVGR